MVFSVINNFKNKTKENNMAREEISLKISLIIVSPVDIISSRRQSNLR